MSISDAAKAMAAAKVDACIVFSVADEATESGGDLEGILTYHVVPGNVLAADVIGLDGQSVATVNGADWCALPAAGG